MAADELLDPSTSSWSVSADSAADVLARHESDDQVVVIAAHSGESVWDPPARDVLAALDQDPDEVALTHEPSGSAGSVTSVPVAHSSAQARLLCAAGLGDGGRSDVLAAGAAAGRAARGHDAVIIALADLDDAQLALWVEGMTLGAWAPARLTDGQWTPGAKPPTSVLVCSATPGAAEVVQRAVRRARATLLARNLTNTPSNIKNPAWMATHATSLAKKHGLDVTIWDDKALAKQGFGGLLAVGGGSANPPRLVQLEYTPTGATPDTARVVLVGKGITFDSGGLVVKPADSMAAMKTDMSGSAIVLAVLTACRDLDIPVRVTGLLALAENMVSGSAYRPGDVVTHFGGTTVEIENTDAEGRIVLADALAYADAELDPDVVVDVATLTGAARVALGRSMAPVYATDTALAEALRSAGQSTGETLWPMPLVDGYREAMDSEVADLSHYAPGVGGGSITAALFLQRFVGRRRWAHLDIAGAGRSQVDAGIVSKGGVGFGTRLLLRWLEHSP